MGFRLEIDGSGPVKLSERCIKNVEFRSEIPEDSNARATDNGASLKIWGKMLFSLGGEEQDSTLNLAKWSVVPSESADSYRKVKVDVISASQVVRQIIQPKIVGDTMGLPPLSTLFLLYLGFKLHGISGMILAVPAGLVVVNLYQYGAFDSLIRNVKLLIQEVNRFRKEE